MPGCISTQTHFTDQSEKIHAPPLHTRGCVRIFQGMQNIITCIWGVQSHWTLEWEHGKLENQKN